MNVTRGNQWEPQRSKHGRERRRVADDESLLVSGLDMNRSIGKVLHNLREQLTGYHRAAFLLNERGHGVLNGELQVGGLEDNFVAGGLDEDARQGQGASIEWKPL